MPRFARLTFPMLVIAAWTMSVAQVAGAQADQRNLVTDATVTLANFLNDPDMTWLKRNITVNKSI